MSAVTIPLAGVLKTYGTKLTATNATAVYTAQSGIVPIVIGINLSNIDGTSAVDATVGWFDASVNATFFLTSTDAVAADTREIIEFPISLDAGDEIRVTASAANDLDVIVSVIEVPGRNSS